MPSGPSLQAQSPLRKDLRAYIIHLGFFPRYSTGSRASNGGHTPGKDLVFHRPLDDPSQMLPSVCAGHIPNTRRQIKYSSLRKSSGNKSIDVTTSVPNRFQTTGHAEAIEEPCNRFIEVCSDFMVWNTRDGGI
jgi:hypothetical protein